VPGLRAYQLHIVMPQLFQQQLIAADSATVWDFFATPMNLNELTPPGLRFEIRSDLPPRMYQGQLIEYRISPVRGVWLCWLTEIRHVREGRYFVDEQRAGPYAFWYHEHHFAPVAGGVLMTDRVTYDVGWGPIGWLAHKVWVRRQLDYIFAYRRQRVEARFGRA
jgi:ligand-binding SRPBCC domain-containing protein